MTRNIGNDLQSEVFSDWLQEKSHALLNRWIVIRIETVEGESEQGLDGVAYNIEGLEKVKDLMTFEQYILNNDYNFEDFEVDRCTLLRIR